MRGVSLVAVKELLGHESIETHIMFLRRREHLERPKMLTLSRRGSATKA
jgi:hypothetical protein